MSFTLAARISIAGRITDRSLRAALRPAMTQLVTSRSRTFEPDYLDEIEKAVPAMPLTNFHFRGYDFAVLERYQGYVHRLAENMGIDVSVSWATPCQETLVSQFQEGSTMVKSSFKLNLYDRCVQVSNMRTIDYPLLLDLIRRTLPEGVSLQVTPHSDHLWEARFIPDPFIEGLKKELQEMEEKRAKIVEDKKK